MVAELHQTHSLGQLIAHTCTVHAPADSDSWKTGTEMTVVWSALILRVEVEEDEESERRQDESRSRSDVSKVK